MKKLITAAILLFIAIITLYSCEQKSKHRSLTEVQDSLVSTIDTTKIECQNQPVDTLIPDVVQLRKRHRTVSLTDSITFTDWWYIDGFWYEYYGRDEAKVKAEMTIRFKETAKVWAQNRIICKLAGMTILRENNSSLSTSAMLRKFHEMYPVTNSDAATYIPYGGNGGIADDSKGGIGTSDKKYAVIKITAAFKMFPEPSPQLQALVHERGHGGGCNHTFDCTYTVDGIPYRQLDITGPRAGYGAFCPKGNDIKTEFATLMSYATLLPDQKYVLEFHEVHKLMLWDYFSKAKLGCPNTVYSVEMKNGLITWKDDYSTEWEIQIAPYNGSFGSWQRVSGQSTQSVTSFAKTTYKSLVEGANVLGARFENKEVNWLDSDTLKFTLNKALPTGITIAYSFWDGSYTQGAMYKVIDGNKIVIPKGKKITAIQIRTSKEVGVIATAISIEKTTFGNKEFKPVNLQPDKYYSVRIKRNCDGYPKEVVVYNPPANIDGYTIYDTGGKTGLYGNNQDIPYYIPANYSVTFWQYVVEGGISNSDRFELYKDGVLIEVFKPGKVAPFTIPASPTGYKMRWTSDSYTGKAGYYFTPKKQ